MRYFVLLDFQYIVLAVCMGIAATILLYVAFGVPVISRKREKEPEHYTDGLQIEKNPIPLILVFIVCRNFNMGNGVYAGSGNKRGAVLKQLSANSVQPSAKNEFADGRTF